ncbi:MAG: GPW/gp25 family protein [Cyanobacteria bacterium J06627_32]
MQIDFPFYISAQQRTATTQGDEHIRDLIEQVLFTSPGERVNRPDFGSGLLQLVFAGNGDALATTTQFMVQGALQQWLGEVIQLEEVTVLRQDATLRVIVRYIVRRTQARRIDRFEREVG